MTASRKRLLHDITNGMRLEVPEFCPANLANMMKQCWCANPDERPSFSGLKDCIMGELDVVKDKMLLLRCRKVFREGEGTEKEYEEIQKSNPYRTVVYTTVDPIRTAALHELKNERVLYHQTFEG